MQCVTLWNIKIENDKMLCQFEWWNNDFKLPEN